MVISTSLTVFAAIVLLYYFMRGEVDGRWRLTVFALASASLTFLAGWAARAWGLLDTLLALVSRLVSTASNAALIVGVPWH